ncbi:hypothetical protein A3Q56_00115 [Intoshia linei]|uniref:Uncharacterized protein n=1 Tax=Intoshia linei TaxID=1819745 RepID=A0A177BD37_9BILA|nr:hypothetical protein A3Q56_00115 [Intoshia linei]
MEIIKNITLIYILTDSTYSTDDDTDYFYSSNLKQKSSWRSCDKKMFDSVELQICWYISRNNQKKKKFPKK